MVYINDIFHSTSIIAHYFRKVKGLKELKMKICAIICEYNPLHNGHVHQIRESKRLTGADAVLCIMSGNFVQRGENAVLDKFSRAKHAIQAGADAVIELPTLFATSNAELFAKGGVKIATAIPSVTHLCFGAEHADKEQFIQTAKLMNDEPSEISSAIKDGLSKGLSYAKARAEAYAAYQAAALLSSPNDILGVEYTRAVLESQSKIEILPIERIGAGYKEQTVHAFPSASAIRTALFNDTLDKFINGIPEFVYTALNAATDHEKTLEMLEKHALIAKPASEIKQVLDCTEGLENALKKAAQNNLSIVESLTSARYTSSRIRRIMLQNLLEIKKTDIQTALQTDLYLQVLAVKKDSGILSALAESNYPLLIRAHDDTSLCEKAKRVKYVDDYAQSLYNILTGKKPKKEIFV